MNKKILLILKVVLLSALLVLTSTCKKADFDVFTLSGTISCSKNSDYKISGAFITLIESDESLMVVVRYEGVSGEGGKYSFPGLTISPTGKHWHIKATHSTHENYFKLLEIREENQIHDFSMTCTH